MKTSELSQSMTTAWQSDGIWYQPAASAYIILISISHSSKWKAYLLMLYILEKYVYRAKMYHGEVKYIRQYTGEDQTLQ